MNMLDEYVDEYIIWISHMLDEDLRWRSQINMLDEHMLDEDLRWIC